MARMKDEGRRMKVARKDAGVSIIAVVVVVAMLAGAMGAMVLSAECGVRNAELRDPTAESQGPQTSPGSPCSPGWSPLVDSRRAEPVAAVDDGGSGGSDGVARDGIMAGQRRPVPACSI